LEFAEAHVIAAKVDGRVAPALSVAGRVPVDALVVAAPLHAGIAPAAPGLLADLGLRDATAFARPFVLVEAKTTFAKLAVRTDIQTIANI
jgi:hypothetical protein